MLMNPDYKNHFRVDHNQFISCRTHINWIESFWIFAKIRSSKCVGMIGNPFYLHFKGYGLYLMI